MSNEPYGYAGNQLRISLNTQEVKTEQIDPGVLRKYLGGAGYGARVLYDELSPGIDPLSPANKLMFVTSPLTANRIGFPEAGVSYSVLNLL
jgi:aldehyde:ferredoxin oxidoreductase